MSVPPESDILALAGDRSESPRAVHHLVGGEWRPARSGRTFDVVEPATGRVLAQVPDAGPEDLAEAYELALAGQVAWARTPVVERATILRELSDRVRDEADRLGLVDTRDTGSPIGEMRADAIKGANALRYMAGLGTEMRGDTIPLRPGSLHYTRLEPWGVVGRIIAFNHPVLFTCGRLAPALMAGNAVIVKAADLAPLGSLAIAQLASDLLPAGVLSVLTGGPELGGALVRHPGIRRLSFTGSVPTALRIAAGAAESGVIKTLTYELGGKNPMVVFPDVDVDQVAAAAVRGMNFTRVQGQSCGSTSRLFLHADVHDTVLERILNLTSSIRMGDPTDASVEMGPLIDQASRDRCLGIVRRGEAEGAEVLCGGAAPDRADLAAGAFMEATVVTGAAHDTELVQQEIFGPVLSVHRWTDRDAVVREANDVRYGLTAAVWTNDLSEALRTADELEAGYIWVNDVETRYPAVPFGGWKDSGSGLEHGIEELLSFTRTKAVNVRYG